MSQQKLRIAHLHLQQADIYRKKEEIENSVAEFTKAIDIYKDLAKEDPAFWSMVADTIESVGATYKAAGELDKALETLQEAAKLREKLLEAEED